MTAPYHVAAFGKMVRHQQCAYLHSAVVFMAVAASAFVLCLVPSWMNFLFAILTFRLFRWLGQQQCSLIREELLDQSAFCRVSFGFKLRFEVADILLMDKLFVS